MPEDQLNSFNLKFIYDDNGQTRTIDFPAYRLQQVEGKSLTEALYKMAAHRQIFDSTSKQMIEDVSIKYQVLVEETAMVGVIEQTDEATGELKIYEYDARKENDQKG